MQGWSQGGLGGFVKAIKTTNQAFQKVKVVLKRRSRPLKKQPCLHAVGNDRLMRRFLGYEEWIPGKYAVNRPWAV